MHSLVLKKNVIVIIDLHYLFNANYSNPLVLLQSYFRLTLESVTLAGKPLVCCLGLTMLFIGVFFLRGGFQMADVLCWKLVT